MKFMLDECMTLRASTLIINALALHKPPIEAFFLENYLGSKGLLDPDWADSLAKEGEWRVITCDSQRPRGERAKLKGPPLHLILPAKKITGFFLGGSIPNRPGFEKFRAVVCVWPQVLKAAASAPPGTRFKITGHGDNYYRIEEWPLAPSPSA